MTVPLDRHYSVELQVSAERVSRLRRIVAAHLRHWSLDLHVRPVCRALDELLTNVHRHVGDGNTCVLELRWTGRHVTVSVADNSARMPRLLPAGGGLSRVMALSDKLGHLPDHGRQSGLVHPLRRGAADGGTPPVRPAARRPHRPHHSPGGARVTAPKDGPHNRPTRNVPSRHA